MTVVRVDPADKSIARELSEVLARAFFDDPLAIYFFPDESVRIKGLRRFFYAQITGLFGPNTVVLTTDNLKAVAIWVKPGKSPSIIRSGYRILPTAFVLKTRVFLAGRAIAYLERFHPRQKHFYLATIGTDPEFQGKGLGSELLDYQLTEIDSKHMPGYLESSKEKNVPYYRRFGFELIKEITLPKNGPPTFLMWRDAK